MSDFLEAISNFLGITDTLFCLFLTLVAVVLTYGLARLAVRRFPFEQLAESGEGFGSFCNVIGVLYAIVLGYVLVNVYETYSTANDKVETEASLLIDLMRDAEGLPLIEGLRLRKATIDYADSVIHQEWDHMVEFGEYHLDTFHKFGQLYRTAARVKCQNDEQRLFLGEIVRRLGDLSATRRERIEVSTERVPDVLWAMMLGVGLVNFFMAFFFPVEQPKIRVLFLCSTAAVMTFTTLLIFVMDRPYKGSLGIKPHSLVKLREIVTKTGFDSVIQEFGDQINANEPPLEKIRESLKKNLID